MNSRADAESHTVDSESTVHGPSIGPAANQWKRQSYLELGAMPSAVPSARLHARLVIHEWGLSDLADTVELMVCELVTNAVQASAKLNDSTFRGTWTPGIPPVRLWVQADEDSVLIQVWDGNNAPPHVERPTSDSEHGRGLLIVQALCERYGVYGLDGCSGKVVWGVAGR
jgi:anti-sigma regulatory factor (Ser/Thr protein kinase)